MWAYQWHVECTNLRAFRLVCACVRHVCMCTWGSASLISLFSLTKHSSQLDSTAVWPLLRMEWFFFDPCAECFLVRFHENHSIGLSLQIAFSHCIKEMHNLRLLDTEVCLELKKLKGQNSLEYFYKKYLNL